MFLKNHAKSKVFQNSYRHGEFFELFVQFEQNFYIFTNCIQAFPDQALTSPSGVQRRIYTPSAKREFDGVRWVGWVGRGIKWVIQFSLYFMGI